MGEQVAEWQMMWGAKVKTPMDMRDDILRDAIETSRKWLEEIPDFEAQGLEIAEKIKKEFDERWEPHWHVVIGRNFGSFVTHETRGFLFFYLGDKAVMVFKAG
mmetsp:Transcript_27777/g.36408  ORF Transcript_27777/g.36408 Transcript_27777/m.36408 type:complete len:103 (+) Transcript_27777:68-376(+)